MCGAPRPANRFEQLVVQLTYGGNGRNDDALPVAGERDLDCTRISRGSGAMDEAAVLEGARQARNVDRLEASRVRQLALAGPCAAQRETVQRRQQHVLRVRESKGSDAAIDRRAPPGGQTPHERTGCTCLGHYTR